MRIQMFAQQLLLSQNHHCNLHSTGYNQISNRATISSLNLLHLSTHLTYIGTQALKHTGSLYMSIP